MSACALVAARIRDGALQRDKVDAMSHPAVSSEVFFAAAKDAMAKDMVQNYGFDYLRASVMLALVSIQYGQLSSMQQYMGQFFTLAAMQRFYDEDHWQRGLSQVETELRRRTYWCAYSIDVFCAATWDCFIRSQEIHSNVRYPSDVDDEFPNEYAPSQRRAHSWLVGWNFTLDLHRVLEHSVSKARSKKFQREERPKVNNLVFCDTFSDNDVMSAILNMYYQLPSFFKETPPMTGNLGDDIYGYQAASIQATLQLLRMILFSMEDGPGIERRCDVASEVLSVFHTIPRPYLHAISAPLIYQLGSIGLVLGSVADEALTDHQFHRARQSLLSMADLLESLETALHRAAGASQALRAEVDRLEVAFGRRRQQQQEMVVRGSTQASPQDNINIHYQLDNLAQQPLSKELSGDFQIPLELMGNWSWRLDSALFNQQQYG